MPALELIVLAALLLGAGGLAAFLWSLNSGQFDDLEGASWRILIEEEEPPPSPDESA